MAKSKKTKKAKKASKALLTAVQQGDVAAVKKCLAKGESPDADTGYGTPMIWVRGLGDNPGVVRALLEGGANVDALENGNTRLVEASEYGEVDLANVLIEFGANVNHAGGEPLCAAVRNEEEFEDAREGIRLLAKHGADLDGLHDWEDPKNDEAPPRQGTALMEAIRRRREKLALLLIELGADLNVKNKKGETALSLAKKLAMGKVAKALAERGAKAGKTGKGPLPPEDHFGERTRGEIKPRKTKTAIHATGNPDIAKVFAGKFPGCGNPPVHLLTLELDAIEGLPKDVAKLRRLHVVHSNCSECDPLDYYTFKIRKDGRLEADPDEHSEEGDCSKDGYTPSKKTSWITFTDVEDWSDSVSIGGEPEWAQHDDWIDCPSCKKRPFFVAQLWQFGLPPGAEGAGNHLFVFTCAPCRRQMLVRQMT